MWQVVRKSLLCCGFFMAMTAVHGGMVQAADTVKIDAFKGQKGTVNIAGGTAHIPVMKLAAREIMTKYPQVVITIAGGGSGLGVEQVSSGLVQIGNTGRPLKKAEVEKFALVSFPFAIDGVAAVVHPSSTVSNVSKKQLADIFLGKITNWKEVGGKDAAITVYTREDGSGTQDCFVSKGLDKGKILPSAAVINSNGAMKTAVAQDENAIGYVSIGHVDNSIKPLNIDGIAANQGNAQSMVYPVVRQLYMNTKGEPQGVTKAFIEYILSPEAVTFIEKSGYIPLKN